MALIQQIERANRERQRVHGAVECTYSVFSERGKRYLQLDTYGSADRAFAGKVSQSIQIDETSARRLQALIAEAFPNLR